MTRSVIFNLYPFVSQDLFVVSGVVWDYTRYSPLFGQRPALSIHSLPTKNSFPIFQSDENTVLIKESWAKYNQIATLTGFCQKSAGVATVESYSRQFTRVGTVQCRVSVGGHVCIHSTEIFDRKKRGERMAKTKKQLINLTSNQLKVSSLWISLSKELWSEEKYFQADANKTGKSKTSDCGFEIYEVRILDVFERNRLNC